MITKMKTRGYPRKAIATQLNTGEFPFLLQKSQTFSFAFSGIWVCAELEIMATCIPFTYDDHLLKGMLTWGKEKVVIRVTKNAKEVTIHPAPNLAPS